MLGACQAPEAPQPPAWTPPEVAPAIAEAAWPDAVAASHEEPAIGMAALPRPAEFAALRRFREGQDIPRDPSMTPDRGPRELEILGEQVYRMYCARCHGRNGRAGSSPRNRMRPPPRDLVRGHYRYRRTPHGAPPTMTDLFRTITGGLQGTPMPPFADLPEDQRWGVAAYLMTLSPVFEKPASEIVVPPLPLDLDTKERSQRGEAVYAKLGCDTCHGAGGRGNGHAAVGVKDALGRAIPVPRLRGGRLKRGRDPVELFATVSTGLNGTPMPGYADAATVEERWSLVAWLRQVARR